MEINVKIFLELGLEFLILRVFNFFSFFLGAVSEKNPVNADVETCHVEKY
jgi:hypothetical protein